MHLEFERAAIVNKNLKACTPWTSIKSNQPNTVPAELGDMWRMEGERTEVGTTNLAEAAALRQPSQSGDHQSFDAIFALARAHLRNQHAHASRQ
jgi:hypothetical protein